MSSFTSLVLVVACAALLNAGCEALHHHNHNNGRRVRDRRNFADSSISLGTIRGTNIISLPKIHIGGPDNILGFPDNCRGRGLELLGTELIVTNSDGGLPVDLTADDTNNAQSNVVVHCKPEYWVFYEHKCPSGLDVVSYQYCGGLLPATTAAPTTASSTVASTTVPSPTEAPSSSNSSSSSSEEDMESL